MSRGRRFVRRLGSSLPNPTGFNCVDRLQYPNPKRERGADCNPIPHLPARCFSDVDIEQGQHDGLPSPSMGNSTDLEVRRTIDW